MGIDKRHLIRDALFGEHINGLKLVAGNREYQLAGKIGDGAIGVVRKVTDLETEKLYAIKFLAPEPKYIEQSSVEDIYQRFKREGERGASLDHENLVQILAYEENQNGCNFLSTNPQRPQCPFIIMEYIHGRTLEDYIRKDKRGIPRRAFNITSSTINIGLQIAKALVHLHKKGIVHRDVKPANVFLSKGVQKGIHETVKLGDFGIVKWGDFRASITTGSLTMTGQVGLGTLKYMAPEQSTHPKDVDVKSDMYSFGVTLFELFTNQIIPSIHHVWQLKELRMDKGDIVDKTRVLELEYTPQARQFDFILERIFDCFLRPSGRPTSTKMVFHLKNILNKAISLEDDEGL